MEGAEFVTSLDGTRIGFRRIGEGRPLVLVHGTSSDHRRWLGVMERLGKGRQLILMDRRGRGASGDAPAYDIAREFEDVAAVIAAAGAEVDLLGHSFGALCGLEAARLTSAVARLILYETPFGIPGYPLYFEDTEETLGRLLKDKGPDAMLVHFLTEIVGMSPAAIKELQGGPDWEGRRAAAPTIVREMVDGSYGLDPARYSSLRVPTLLLVGGASTPALRIGNERLAGILPDARLREMPGQGHVAMLTAPELFCREVLEFLANVPAK